jgi:endoglucanase
MHPTRREFLATATLTTFGASGLCRVFAADNPAVQALPEPSARKLPVWRGFNLLEKFTKRRNGNQPFSEQDFEWIAGWGFNFVRLPMSYLCWTEPADWLTLLEPELKHIDQAVEFGRQYNVHVNLNFHRAPGYCVNPPAEPLDLWTDAKALDACAHHWSAFAKRYQASPTPGQLRPAQRARDLPDEVYPRGDALVEAIRAEDPQRLVIADGLRWGRKPVPGLVPLGVGQSTRGYDPMRISHHGASWVNGQNWPVPAWPLELKPGDVWNKDRLRREIIGPWKNLKRRG